MNTGNNSLIVEETGRRWYHVPSSKQTQNTWQTELKLYQVVSSDGWWAYQEDNEPAIGLFIEEHAEQSSKKEQAQGQSQFHKLAAALTVEETWKVRRNWIRWHRWSPKSHGSFASTKAEKRMPVSGNLFATARSQVSLLPPTLHQSCPCVHVRDAELKKPAPLYSVRRFSNEEKIFHLLFCLPPSLSSLFEIQALITLKMVSKRVQKN